MTTQLCSTCLIFLKRRKKLNFECLIAENCLIPISVLSLVIFNVVFHFCPGLEFLLNQFPIEHTEQRWNNPITWQHTARFMIVRLEHNTGFTFFSHLLNTHMHAGHTHSLFAYWLCQQTGNHRLYIIDESSHWLQLISAIDNKCEEWRKSVYV